MMMKLGIRVNEDQKPNSSTTGTNNIDIKSSFSDLFRRASPLVCLSGQEDKEPTMDDVLPDLLRGVSKVGTSTAALRCLYQMCDQRHKDNRIPMVCSSKWDVISPLIHHLTEDEEENKHLSLLTLNNLSIPFENKAVMTLGHVADELLGNLCTLIQLSKPEAYLCCICLVNLSYLDDAVEPILWYSPSRDGGCHYVSPLENPNSLLRIIENVMNIFKVPPEVVNVHSETTRWSCALMRNLSATEKNANLICQTDIPARVVGYLRQTKVPISRWTNNSIEDSSLRIICNLARWPQPKQVLIKLKAVEAIDPIIGGGGIHDFRASIIRCCLEP